jgi:hypothetical protein
MGIFGKKSGAPSLTGSYKAPSDSSASTPVQGPTSKAASKASKASTAKSQRTEKDVDVDMSDDLATVLDDDRTMDSRTYKTDDQTYKTEYTEPALVGIGTDDEESKDSAFTITRNGEYLTMNGFANGHLMRWKFAAEEGPAFIRFPAVLLSLAVIGTTLYPIVVNHVVWSVSSAICATHTCIAASLILILEGRVVVGSRSPTNFRARIRTVVTRYFNIFRLLWGRGLLYIYVGTMNMTIDHEFSVYTGLAIVAFGFLAIASGAHASYNLDKMKTSLTDEAYLWSKFDALDTEHDDSIDLNGFAELLWSLGMEFDDAYTFKAFSQIERDAGAKITFEQFRDWWIVTQHKGKSLKNSGV